MILKSDYYDFRNVGSDKSPDKKLMALSESILEYTRILGPFFILVMLSGCSPNLQREHVFQITDEERSDGGNENVIMTVFERGQYVLAFDGKMWRSDFVKARYSLKRNGDQFELPFLTVKDPIELWDNFVKIDDTWFSIDISGSPFRDEETTVHVIQFSNGKILRRIDAPWNEMPCRIQSVSILNDGTGIIIDNSFEGKLFLDFTNGDGLVVLDELEYMRQLTHAKTFENDGIFLNMGISGTFGLWCQ